MWAYVISGVAYVLTFILGLYFKIAIKINLRGDDDMCTGITFRASNGDVIFGRTMDYDYPLNGFPAVQPRGYSFKSHVDYKGKRYMPLQVLVLIWKVLFWRWRQ